MGRAEPIQSGAAGQGLNQESIPELGQPGVTTKGPFDELQPFGRRVAPRAYTADADRLGTKAHIAAKRAKERPKAAPEENGDVLARTIRRWAKTTSVDELAARGVKTVRSVSMARMGALLEKAVNRALIERTLDSDAGDALSLSSSARETFLELTRSEVAGDAALQGAGDFAAGFAGGEAGLDGSLQSRATSTLDRLKRELEERRKTVADHEKQLSDGEIDAAEDNKVAGRMRELFATYAGTGDDRALEVQSLGLVLTELRKSRRRARRARLDEHHREISTLERRIAKLSALLGETEDALRQVKLGKTLDPGVSSIYDSVQGLTDSDGMFEQKVELMKSIFDANMALRS